MYIVYIYMCVCVCVVCVLMCIRRTTACTVLYFTVHTRLYVVCLFVGAYVLKTCGHIYRQHVLCLFVRYTRLHQFPETSVVQVIDVACGSVFSDKKVGK